MNDAKDSMGKKIKAIRKKHGLSQEKLGEMVGVSYQQIQKYEKGVNRVSSDMLYKIARSLNIPVTYFFQDEQPVSGEGGLPYMPPSRISAEEAELIRYFRAIKDREYRSHLIALLGSAARLESTVR